MTQLIIDGELEQDKIDLLQSMIRSWNVDVKIRSVEDDDFAAEEDDDEGDSFDENDDMSEDCMVGDDPDLPLAIGMWKDRDITDKQLRELAWGTKKRWAR